MKNSFFLICLIFIGGCVYDPPVRGKDIFIENQTDDYIYVCDDINKQTFLKLHDTFLINDKKYIAALPNYIPKFSKWNYFISEAKQQEIKNKNNDIVRLFFIRQRDIEKNINLISKDGLYTKFEINLSDIQNHQINYIFYYHDSIFIAHEYRVKKNK